MFCSLPTCGENIGAREPRVRALWQASTYAVAPHEPSRTIATFHDRCWQEIEAALGELTERMERRRA